MNAMPDIRNHSHAEMLLDDYVMGTLSAGDLAWMDEHIPTCAICQTEVPLLLEATFALPFALDEPAVAMSDDVWDRIELSIQPQAMPAPASGDPPADPYATWPETPDHQAFIPLDLERDDAPPSAAPASLTPLRSYKWFALAAAAVLVLGLGAVLTRSLWWPDDESPAMQTIAMVDASGNPIGNDVAELQYDPDHGMLILHMEDMPTAPEGQVYQAWLIAGDVPTSIGMVDPATGVFEEELDLADYDAFAITVEPGPAGSELPTSDPIVVAPLISEA